MGEVCMIPAGLKCCLGQRQVLLRPKCSVNGKYLFWALQSPFVQHQISWNEGTGSTVSNVRIPVLKALNIPRHPDQEDEIAEVLSNLADKIQLNRQTNQILEQIAQAIFKSWFVDFEPVKAKMEAKSALSQALSQRERAEGPLLPLGEGLGMRESMELAAICAISGKTEAELQTLDADTLKQLKTTAALFPDALVESELGEVPEGWEVRKLSEVAENNSKTFDFSKVEKVIFVNTGDVLEGRFLHSEYSSKEGLPGQAKKAIKMDDILFSEIRPKNKRFAYVSEVSDDYVVSTKFMVIRSLGCVHPRYLYQILRQKATIQEFNIIAESRSGTFPQITFDSIGYIPIVVPSESIQNAFMEFFTPIIAGVDRLNLENETLAQLRDILLPKLLSGELALDNTETRSEAVA